MTPMMNASVFTQVIFQNVRPVVNVLVIIVFQRIVIQVNGSVHGSRNVQQTYGATCVVAADGYLHLKAMRLSSSVSQRTSTALIMCFLNVAIMMNLKP